MERRYNCYDCLRYELFVMLMPTMLYEGTEEQKEEFFQLLIRDGKRIIHNMYRVLCKENELPYPCEEGFEVNIFERGCVNILQILISTYNANINDIMRAYLLFTRLENGSCILRYFVIKKFRSGRIFNLYITPEGDKLLGEELTGHLGDMEYEYWKLVCDFSRIVLQDMGLEEKWGNKESYDIASEEKQLEEYFRWLYENAPEEYEKLMLYIVLREKGMDEQNAEFCLSHLEELPQALEMIWEDGEKK